MRKEDFNDIQVGDILVGSGMTLSIMDEGWEWEVIKIVKNGVDIFIDLKYIKGNKNANVYEHNREALNLNWKYIADHFVQFNILYKDNRTPLGKLINDIYIEEITK